MALTKPSSSHQEARAPMLGEHAVTQAEWTTAVSELVDAARSARAVHRPVLLLYMLGRAQRKEAAEVSFQDLESAIGPALDHFGRAKKAEVLLPFWHLQSSPFWHVPNANSFPRREGKDRPTRSALIRGAATGRIKTEWWASLAVPELVSTLGESLLRGVWTTSQDQDLACELLRFQRPRESSK